MVVDHADCLHESVDDGRADKTETAPLEVLADRIRRPRAGRHLPHAAPAVLQRPPAGEAPEISVEGAEFPLHVEEGAGVADGGLDLEAIAHDPRVAEQPFDVAGAKARHLDRVEPGEGAAIVLPLVEDRGPGQPGLRALEYQELEQAAVVVDRDTPLHIVIADVQFAAETPRAALGTSHAA